MRKTKKYYRDEINTSYSRACAVLKEVILKYGTKTGHRWRRTRCKVSNEWNGCIEGFEYKPGTTKKVPNPVYVDFYWQGQHTDGNEFVPFKSSGIFLDALYEYDDFHGCTTETHGTVEFDSNELYEAIKQVAKKYLK